MEFALVGLQWQTCLVCLDDVIVYGQDFDEPLEQLREVFHRFRQAGLKLKPSSVSFYDPECRTLVLRWRCQYWSCKDWSSSTVPLKVRSFLGLAPYYQRFIQNFAKIATPLHCLTAKTTEKFKWSPDCDLAFRVLKGKFISAPVLAFPYFDQEFVVDCDASDYGLGAVISQRQDRDEKVIAYASRVLEDHKLWYSTTKKEMLAMVYTVKHFCHYLCGLDLLQLGQTTMHLNGFRASKSPKVR